MDVRHWLTQQTQAHRLRLFAFAAALPLVLAAAMGSDAKDAAPPPHTSDVANPLMPLTGVPADSGAKWQAAIALLPDPIDTRLGRTFDIQVATLIRSFQFDGYVLQSHAMPWRLQDPEGELRHHQSPGVLVFRKDVWRYKGYGSRKTLVEYYALFLVGESPVFGIQRVAFCQAIMQAAAINGAGRTPQAADSRACSATLSPQGKVSLAGPLVVKPGTVLNVLGPNFSGSLSSLADAARKHAINLHLLSHSATVSNNNRIDFAQGVASLSFLSMASWDQTTQMQDFFSYLQLRHDICPSQVVVLAEESAFGAGAIAGGDQLRTKCEAGQTQPRYVQFPQNISAIRAEHAEIASQRAGKKVRLLPTRFLEMDMKGAAESPDLPQVYQPKLSSRTDELSLQQLMDALATYVRPRAVLIVATDVRDRIFMLGAVRRAIPGAIPAVLEGDHLLAHPEYRRANRGTLMVSSGQMLLCYGEDSNKQLQRQTCRSSNPGMRYLAFPTDDAANLFRASHRLLTEPGRPEMETYREDGETPLAVVTLAGTQPIPVGFGSSPSAAGSLIAADLRSLAFRLLLPGLVILSALLVVCSFWLTRSSRPARVMLPLSSYALREVGWRIEHLARRKVEDNHEPGKKRGRGPSAEKDRATERTRLTDVYCRVLCLVSLFLFALGLWKWLMSLGLVGWKVLDLRQYLRLVHGRDMVMLLTIALLYLWISILAIARIDSWNARCMTHWENGEKHVERKRYSMRRFHRSAFILACVGIAPILTVWLRDPPSTVDATFWPTAIGVVVFVTSGYFLAQAILQWQRLSKLGRDIRDHVMPTMRSVGLDTAWPTPDKIGIAPRSPLAVLCHDADLYALAQQPKRHWPLLFAYGKGGPPSPPPASSLVQEWCERTVSEFRFGLTCVRSCVWAAFAGPLAVLMMIQVHPFAFEWEQSTIALGILTLVFVVMVQLVVASERAPMIGQMFTADGGRVSTTAVFKAVSGKFLVLVLTLAATLTPGVGEWAQNLISMLRI